MKSQTPSEPLRGLGILNFLKKPRGSGDSQRTNDPGLPRKILRKLDRAQGDAELMEIGKSDPLEEVARAAYKRVGSQKELASHIRTMTNRPRQLLALECLTDQRELKDLAQSLGEPLCVEVVKRISDAGLLTALGEDKKAPDAARCAAYEKLNQPRMADGMRLASSRTLPPERERAAERILQTGDTALITRVAELVLASQETPQARSFVIRASKVCPDEMLQLAYNTWGMIPIKVTALEALGRVDEAQLVRLTSDSIPENERQAAAACILESGDETLVEKATDIVLSGRQDAVARQFLQNALEAYPGLIRTFGPRMMSYENLQDRKRIGAVILEIGDEKLMRQTVERLLAGKQDSVKKQFVLDAATAFPEIIQELWPRVRQWGRVDINKHTDQTDVRSDHVDFRPSYDPSMHHDGMAPSSDCADNGHTDMSSHTDNSGSLKGYLARFPKAVRGDD